VAPTTGARCFRDLPSLKAERVQRFRDALAQADPDRLHILRLANRTAHTAPQLIWPTHVCPVWRPPYGPELDPIARVGRDLQDGLAWLPWPTLQAQQDDVGQVRQADDASPRPALTGYTSLVEAIHARTS
jgi:hypothetical protein